MPSVAVLIAAYNAVDTLPRCLDSLCSQTLSDIELICIDDCSTDATPTLLQERAAADPRIVVIRTPHNSGQAMARNLGLERVTAPYVCMVDADDWLSHDCLQQALDVIQAHPQTDCVAFSVVMHYDADGGREQDYGLPAPLARGQALSGIDALRYCADGWALHGLYLTRTELHRQIPFDTTSRLYSDDNTSRLHYLHSREVRACGGRYYYRRHAQSLTTSFNILSFDFMEANLSLRRALHEYELTHSPLPEDIKQMLETQRWSIFLRCYRLYIVHRDEFIPEQQRDVSHRLTTTLATFSTATLPASHRRRFGYLLLRQPTLFALQQRLFVALRRLLHKPIDK